MVDTDTTPEEREQARQYAMERLRHEASAASRRTEAVERQLKEALEEIAALKAASAGLSPPDLEQLLSVLSVVPGNVTPVDELRTYIARACVRARNEGREEAALAAQDAARCQCSGWNRCECKWEDRLSGLASSIRYKKEPES